MYVVYIWPNGAYISGMHLDFLEDLAGIISQFGPPEKCQRRERRG